MPRPRLIPTLATLRALVLAFACMLAPSAPAQNPAQKAAAPIKLTDAVAKELIAAQKALTNGNLAEARSRASAARTKAVTPRDRYFVGVILIQVAKPDNDQTLARLGANDMVESGDGGEGVNAPLLYVAALYSFDAGRMAEAVERGRRAIALDPGNVDARVVLSNAYSKLGQAAEAHDALAQAIRLQSDAGKTVPSEWTQREAALAQLAGRPSIGGASPAAPPPAQVASAPGPTPAAAAPATAALAARGPRVALVIGNGAYAGSLGRLANPVADAQLIARNLRALGFDVELVTDVDQRSMKQAIGRLGRRLAAAGKGASGLFYYAGHGVQAKGVNYLIPTGAQPESEADLDLDAVPADAVMSQMADAGAATSIVILDACRNMPLARGTRGGSRGLARMDAPGGSYIAYSTAPGQEAADGSGTNSPFATAFAAEMQKPGAPIETVLRNVRASVHAATGGKQTPWDASSLFTTFVFNPQ